jgi:hypothetical protein
LELMENKDDCFIAGKTIMTIISGSIDILLERSNLNSRDSLDSVSPGLSASEK